MSNGVKILLGFVAVVVLGAVVLVSSVIGLHNQAVKLEKGIEAQYKQNQNSYDNFFKKVVETTGLSERYADDFKNVYTQVMASRYGEDGSKAAFQWIQEQNPQLDASVYVKIQQLVDAGRSSFAADQTALLDKKRVYETFLNSVPSGLVVKFLGFPKINLAQFDIVTSTDTATAFETKKAAPLNLGPKRE